MGGYITGRGALCRCVKGKNCVIIDVKSGWQRKQGTQWLSFVDNVMDLLLCPKINGKAFARNALKM